MSNDEEFVRRVPTHIEGFDVLVEGGIPENFVVLLTGSCGTGKTIFALNFLVAGAMNNEPGLYISLEQSAEETIRQMKMFGWPIDRLISEKKLVVMEPELYKFDELKMAIDDTVRNYKIKRLVIDSASIIGMFFEKKYIVRKSLLDLGKILKKLKCTTIAIDEIPEGSETLSTYGVEEFVADGVIVLYYIKKGNSFLRAISVRKMRATNHSTDIFPIKIERKKGVVVYPSEQIFTDV